MSSRSIKQNKNFLEKKDYKDDLLSYKPIDKTFTRDESIEESDSSTIDSPDQKPPEETQKKSFLLKLKDLDFLNIKNNYFAPIIVGVVLIFISMFIGLIKDVAVIENEVENNKEEINKISNKNDLFNESVENLKNEFEILKIEVSKDITYLEKIIGLNKK